MSTSRSTSPTPKTFSTLNSPDSTTSRIPVQLRSPSEPTLPGRKSQSPPFTPVSGYPLQHPSQSISSGSTDSQMTRRLRSEQTLSRPFLEYSTSSYSHDYVASTSKRKRPSESPGPSSKKKRTRTLTTPHQAAVLHALLAKSRFPNATVREEVGRSIGLSARKVQVWFQNQRQKARRPQNQSNMSHRLPHNFGTFPRSSGSFPLPTEPSTSYSASTSHSAEMRRSVARPGIPGLQSSSDLAYCEQRIIPPRPDTAYERSIRYRDLRDQSLRSPSPVHLYLPPAVPYSASSTPYKHDPSRTLPPLIFPPTISRPSFSAPGSSSGLSRAVLDPPYQRENRSLTPENIFSYQLPGSTHRHSYVVQPQLQRSASSFESAYKPSHSPQPWALREHSTASRSVTPSVPTTERPPSSDVTAAAVRPPERSRRYDPIRGTFIYSSPPEEH